MKILEVYSITYNTKEKDNFFPSIYFTSITFYFY